LSNEVAKEGIDSIHKRKRERRRRGQVPKIKSPSIAHSHHHDSSLRYLNTVPHYDTSLRYLITVPHYGTSLTTLLSTKTTMEQFFLPTRRFQNGWESSPWADDGPFNCTSSSTLICKRHFASPPRCGFTFVLLAINCSVVRVFLFFFFSDSRFGEVSRC
jgi:hypothetical protein